MSEDVNLLIPSNKTETLIFLENKVNQQISDFKARRKFYRKETYRFTLIIAGLSAITTILIGVSQSYDDKIISVIALVTSAMTSFVTAWENLYGFRQRWIQNNETLMKLYELRDDIEYKKVRSGNQLALEEIDKFNDRYKTIIKAANEKWQEDRTPK
ncbi:MAG: DUF4231 domain-containing protein [Moorea sp. SIO2B7]|nr:DUF4231 domain-containing protein [Moorena sp. SIO2B7]